MNEHVPANKHVPVTDWFNDFDHTDPQWTEDPFPIWDELRGKCPVVHTDRFLGVYLPTTYEAVKQISYDTESFSSRRIIVRNVRPETSAADAADHHRSAVPQARQAAAAAAVHARRDEEARAARARDLQRADRRVHQGRQASTPRPSYTKHIPMRAIAHMLGIPEKDGDLFIKWIHEILELGITDDETLMRAAQRDGRSISSTRSRRARSIRPRT